jgi:uncharacterized membrane protein YdjX (TVP38/TMEM64 family)
MKVRIKLRLVNPFKKFLAFNSRGLSTREFLTLEEVKLVMSAKTIWKASLIGLIIVLVYFLFFTNSGAKLTHTNLDDLVAQLRSYGPYALVIGILAILLQTFIPFSPFILIAGANVLVFGFITGFIINYVAASFGAVLAFLFARHLGRAWVERKMTRFPMMQQFNKRLEQEGFIYVLLGRLMFIFPSSVVNYGGGISKISNRDFITATWIGKFPVIFMECLIVHDLQHLHQYRGRLLLLLTILILLIIIGNWMRQKSSRRQK